MSQGYKPQAHSSRSAQINGESMCIEGIEKCYKTVIFGDRRVSKPAEVRRVALKNTHTPASSVLPKSWDPCQGDALIPTESFFA